MKDYHDKLHLIKYTGIVTAEQFAKLYEEIANSPDKVPVASTPLPFLNTDGSTMYKLIDGIDHPLVYGYIFYEMQAPESKTEQPKKKLTMM